MLAPVFPSILAKFNTAGNLVPAKAMGLLVSTYAACMYALSIYPLVCLCPGPCLRGVFRCYLHLL